MQHAKSAHVDQEAVNVDERGTLQCDKGEKMDARAT